MSFYLLSLLIPESPLPFETNTFSNRYCPRFLRLEIISKRAKVNQTRNCPKCWPSRNMFWYFDSRINELLHAILILKKPSNFKLKDRCKFVPRGTNQQLTQGLGLLTLKILKWRLWKPPPFISRQWIWWDHTFRVEKIWVWWETCQKTKVL